MSKHRILSVLLWVCTFIFALFADAMAQSTYQVIIDTSPLLTTNGFIDLQFNPSDAKARDAAVQITNFTLDGGTLSSTASDSGGASGTLPSDVNIVNTYGYNDLFQGLVFSNKISFLATFSGDALTSSIPSISGTGFSVGLYSSDGTTPLLTNSFDATLLHIDINDGTQNITTETFPDANGVFHATINPVAVSVPEPSSKSNFVSVILAFSSLFFLVWRRSRHSKA